MVGYLLSIVFVGNIVNEATRIYIRRNVLKKGYKIVTEIFDDSSNLESVFNTLNSLRDSNILIISEEPGFFSLKTILNDIFGESLTIKKSKSSYLYSFKDRYVNLITTNIDGNFNATPLTKTD